MKESEDNSAKLGRNFFITKCLADVESRVINVSGAPSLQKCKSLDDYGLYFGTDKSSTLHNLCGQYEKILSVFKEWKFNLVEFGVMNCASLNMWAAYFPTATIIGIDPNSESVKNFVQYDNIRLMVTDAYDFDAVKQILSQYPPLVIIDDATHYWSHQINGFEAYFPSVLPSGYYIVEDIETSYGDFRKGIWADQQEDAAAYFLHLASYVAGSASHGIHPLATPQLPKLAEKIGAITFIRDSVLIAKK